MYTTLIALLAASPLTAAAALPIMDTPLETQTLLPRDAAATGTDMQEAELAAFERKHLIEFLKKYTNDKRDVASAQNVPQVTGEDQDISDEDLDNLLKYFSGEAGDDDEEGGAEKAPEEEEATPQVQRRGFVDWLEKVFKTPAYKKIL